MVDGTLDDADGDGLSISRSPETNETKHYYASNTRDHRTNMVQGQVLEDLVPDVRRNGVGRAPRKETLY